MATSTLTDATPLVHMDGLSYRTVKILRRVGIVTLGQLMALPVNELATIPDMGRKSINEIVDTTLEAGLEYGSRLQGWLRSGASLRLSVDNALRRQKWGVGGGPLCVYFVQCEQFVKIGVACSASERIRDLQVANPFELKTLAVLPSLFATTMERDLHRRFKHLRVRGEWFRYEGELERYIEKVRREHAA